jgi:serine/threonine-protein kinase
MGAEPPMKSERWRQVEELFHAALELAPDERQAFLAQACSEDAELRLQVEHLISIDRHAGSHLERLPNELRKSTPAKAESWSFATSAD